MHVPVRNEPIGQTGASAAEVSERLANARLRPRGSNHVGMGKFNERVVLHAIRLHGQLSKAEIARVTHLTAQTVQIIIARLEADGLLLRLPAQRGRVGQPSVPMALDPDGAFSIGIKIGRRSMDMLLVDFVGRTRERFSIDYALPEPDSLFDLIGQRLAAMTRDLPARARRRLHGVGVAAPLSLGGWKELLGMPSDLAARWAAVDMRERVAAITDLPVMLVKDTAAACVAELVAGRGRSIGSFLYIFIDTFVGGGLVVDSHLHGGLHGNAGAVGSMPLGLASAKAERAPAQLLSVASLYQLEARFSGKGLDPAAAGDDRSLAQPWRASTLAWVAQAAPAIALAINSAAGLLDIDDVIVDGAGCPDLLDLLLSHIGLALDRYDWEGVARPSLWRGTIGSDARAIGGALLPLHANFAPDRELFLKLGV